MQNPKNKFQIPIRKVEDLEWIKDIKILYNSIIGYKNRWHQVWILEFGFWNF